MTKKIFATSVWTIIIVGQLLFGGHTVKAYSTSSVMEHLRLVAGGSYDVNTDENTLYSHYNTSGPWPVGHHFCYLNDLCRHIMDDRWR